MVTCNMAPASEPERRPLGLAACQRSAVGRRPARRGGNDVKMGTYRVGAADAGRRAAVWPGAYAEGSATVGYLINGQERLHLSEVKIYRLASGDSHARLSRTCSRPMRPGNELQGEVFLGKAQRQEPARAAARDLGRDIIDSSTHPASDNADVVGTLGGEASSTIRAARRKSRSGEFSAVARCRQRHHPDRHRRSSLPRRPGAGR